MPLKLTQEVFIERANKIHNNKYDYSNFIYVNNETKGKIKCRIHGEFLQTPHKHLSGSGCRKCGYEIVSKKHFKTINDFLIRAKKVHGDKYDYTNSVYFGMLEKINILCKKCEKEFYQRANDHIHGYGCTFCFSNFRLTDIEFIKRAREIHGDKYDYSRVDYKNFHTKIVIICQQHGEFQQEPAAHICGKQGCWKCYRQGRIKTLDEFIRDARRVHGDKYDYSLIKPEDIKNVQSKVNILCLNHNKIFKQRMNNHVSFEQGCPICSKTISIKEQKWLELIGIPSDTEHRQVKIKINKTKYFVVDGIDPLTKIVYEFLGDIWHGNPDIFKAEDEIYFGVKMGDLYQKWISKKKYLEENGYKVISIWESEWDKQIKENEMKIQQERKIK